jgi:hypothetical protein
LLAHSPSDNILPAKVHVDSNDGAVQEKWAIRFLDWKFGDGVDESLLKTEGSTPSKIRNSVDFIQIKQKFDRLK